MKPRKRLKLIYWDSCIFFAWIKDEPWPDDIKNGIEQTLEHAYSNQLAIVTSSVTLTEVIQSQLTMEQKERYAKIFQHPNLQLYDVDRRIAGKASVIREFYDTRRFNDKQQISGSFMSLGDSLQLATALHLGVREFHTLDGAGKQKRISLLALNGNVAGATLAILKPYYVKPPEHLTGPPLEAMQGGQTSLLDLLEKPTSEEQPQIGPIPAVTVITKPEEEKHAEESSPKPLTIPAPAEVPGSVAGSAPGEARAEAPEEKVTGKAQGTASPKKHN
jgi:hypothetical protein